MATALVKRAGRDTRQRLGRRRVTALVRLESSRLFRSPIVWVGFLLSAAWIVFARTQLLPVLHRDIVRDTQGILPLLGAGIIASALTASRARRYEVEETIRSLPRGTLLASLSQAVACLSLAVPASVLLFADLLYLRLADGQWGPGVGDAATWPLLAVLTGLLGVATERWFRTDIAPFIVVLLFFGSALLAQDPPGASPVASGFRSLGPWMPLIATTPEFDVRPSVLHLLYLIGLSSLLLILGMAREFSLRSTLISASSITAAVGLLGAGLVGSADSAVLQKKRLLDPDTVQVCEVEGDAKYCAYPAYAKWIDRWKAVITPIYEASPAAAPKPSVTQRPIDAFASTLPRWLSQMKTEFIERIAQWESDGDVHPGMTWHRPPADGPDQLSLAIKAATRLMNLDSPRSISGSSDGAQSCNVLGQGRGAITLWLAGQATATTTSTLKEAITTDEQTDQTRAADRYQSDGALTDLRSRYIPAPKLRGGAYIAWTDLDAAIAKRLLDLPQETVRGYVANEWADLISGELSARAIVRQLHLGGINERLLTVSETAPIEETCD